MSPKGGRKLDPVQLIYGWDRNTRAFEIVTEQAAETLLAAKRCQTWGEYADLCGMSWSEMAEEYELEVSPDAPFSFSEGAGLWLVADLVRDPRTDAYDLLVENLPRDVQLSPVLDGKVVWHHGSPAGHLECVTAVDEDGVRLLERLIHEAGHTEYAFRRDDALIRGLWEV